MDIKKLENVMKKEKVSNIQIAKLLNIDESTWYRKRSKPKGIKIGEVEKIVEYLHLDDQTAKEIFFAVELAKMRENMFAYLLAN